MKTHRIFIIFNYFKILSKNIFYWHIIRIFKIAFIIEGKTNIILAKKLVYYILQK